MAPPPEVQQEGLPLIFRAFFADVNDPNIPIEVFRQYANQSKLMIDVIENGSNSLDNSVETGDLQPLDQDDEELFAASSQDQHGPTLSPQSSTPPASNSVTSRDTLVSHFSESNIDGVSVEQPEHCQATEVLGKIPPSGFQGFSSEDEQEQTSATVMTARAVTFHRLHVIKAGPYNIDDAQNRNNSGYNDVITAESTRETQHEPGTQLMTEFLQCRAKTDVEALQDPDGNQPENEHESTSSPSFRDGISRRQQTEGVSDTDDAGTSASMPRLSRSLPRETDSTFLSDAHIHCLTFLLGQRTYAAENASRPNASKSEPHDSTFLRGSGVLHISLLGETASEAQEGADTRHSQTNPANLEKRDSLFLWKADGTCVELPVPESCWEVASRLCCVRAETATSDEQTRMNADMRQLVAMIEVELAKWP